MNGANGEEPPAALATHISASPKLVTQRAKHILRIGKKTPWRRTTLRRLEFSHVKKSVIVVYPNRFQVLTRGQAHTIAFLVGTQKKRKSPGPWIEVDMWLFRYQDHACNKAATERETSYCVATKTNATRVRRDRYEYEWHVPTDIPTSGWFILGIQVWGTWTYSDPFAIHGLGVLVTEILDELVWCPCGAIRDDATYDGLWLQCDICKSWQHADCRADLKKDLANEGYLCNLCDFDLSVTLIQAYLQMMERCFRYRRRQEYVFCCTPQYVTQFLRTLIRSTSDIRCLDLGGGTGSLSRALPQGSVSVEHCLERLEIGASTVPTNVWWLLDYTSEEFLLHLHDCKYDLVVSNPDFEIAMQTIFIGSQGLNLLNSDARLIMLLPTDFFEGSKVRSRLYNLLNMHIETEYRLGRVAYYANQGRMTSTKHSSDSLFVMKPGRRTEVHNSVNIRLSGLL
jgi:hypothetical protein